MATASPNESSLECPICHEDFDDPKILPCTHLACKKCVLSWLSKRGSDGGCPLCRAPILSTRPAQDQLAKMVDALPTNFAVMALVESQQVLTSPHECGLCDHVTCTSYCLQCNLKLCKNCAKGHKKIPSTAYHVIEDLNKVTVERLAETNRIMCKAHPDRLGELYCPAHKEVICILCIGTSHESCTGKKSIADAAGEKRAELKDRACALRQSEATIARQIKDVKDAYKVVRKRVKDTFDDIQKTTEKRKQQLEREIQAQEDAAMTAIKSMDTTRASLASNANTLEQLVSTAPQAALLAMVADLTSRLDQLQSHTATTTAGQLQVPEFTVDDGTLRQLKSDISSLGLMQLQKVCNAHPIEGVRVNVQPFDKWVHQKEDGSIVDTTSCQSRPVPDKFVTEVLLTGPVNYIADDHLINFLEVYTDVECEVKSIHRGNKQDVALIEFAVPVDMQVLESACIKTLLEGHQFEIKPVSKNGAVLVRGFDPQRTSTSSLEFHFRHKRFGGSTDARVERDTDGGRAIVWYDSKEVAKRVRDRIHRLEGCSLHVELFNPDLNTSPVKSRSATSNVRTGRGVERHFQIAKQS